MGKNYDNWERLVTSVVRREQLRQLALSHSRTPSIISSRLSSFSYSSSFVFHESLVPGPILDEDIHQSCFLDKGTGQKCYLIGARGLAIFSPGASQYWTFRPHPGSRWPEVAELHAVRSLDVRCRIKARMLPQRTSYAVYLVFSLAASFRGLGSAKTTTRFVHDESDRDAEKRAKVVHLDQVVDDDRKGRVSVVERADGWMEVEIGYFYVGLGDDGELEVRFFETSKIVVKSGLIVEGVEYRPMIKGNKTPLVSKQCMSRIAMA